MGKLSLDEMDNVNQIFPTLDKDSSRILLYFMKNKKYSDEVLIVDIMKNCFFEETEGIYNITNLLKYFEKKVSILKDMKFGKEKYNVFDSIKIEYLSIKYSFSNNFIRGYINEE